MDQFGRKILSSGYTLHQARKIVLDGIRGWERKKLRMMKDTGKLFRTSRESLRLRTKRKLLGKTSWYKGKKKEDKHHAKADKPSEDKATTMEEGGGQEWRTKGRILRRTRPKGRRKAWKQ